MNITVYNKTTKEVIASIDTKQEDMGFCVKDVEVCISEYEPVFKNIGGTIYFMDNKFIVK